jgi:hypothetical protein
MTGWNLPPGCTDRDIEEAAGAFDDDKSALASEEEEAAEAWEYWHQRAMRLETALHDLCEAWEWCPSKGHEGGKFKGNVTNAHAAAKAALLITSHKRGDAS